MADPILRLALAQLERALIAAEIALDVRGPKVAPQGADWPLDPVPEVVAIAAADVRRAIEAWDDRMPARYAGLLDAEVLS